MRLALVSSVPAAGITAIRGRGLRSPRSCRAGTARRNDARFGDGRRVALAGRAVPALPQTLTPALSRSTGGGSAGRSAEGVARLPDQLNSGLFIRSRMVGPHRTMNVLGKMNRTSGKLILTDALAAIS